MSGTRKLTAILAGRKATTCYVCIAADTLCNLPRLSRSRLKAEIPIEHRFEALRAGSVVVLADVLKHRRQRPTWSQRCDKSSAGRRLFKQATSSRNSCNWRGRLAKMATGAATPEPSTRGATASACVAASCLLVFLAAASGTPQAVLRKEVASERGRSDDKVVRLGSAKRIYFDGELGDALPRRWKDSPAIPMFALSLSRAVHPVTSFVTFPSFLFCVSQNPCAFPAASGPRTRPTMEDSSTRPWQCARASQSQ